MSDSNTIQLNCAHCGGPMSLQLVKWANDGTVVRTRWPCPYCDRENTVQFPWRLIWVTVAHRQARPL